MNGDLFAGWDTSDEDVPPGASEGGVSPRAQNGLSSAFRWVGHWSTGCSDVSGNLTEQRVGVKHTPHQPAVDLIDAMNHSVDQRLQRQLVHHAGHAAGGLE
jgi:hypothetical protein